VGNAHLGTAPYDCYQASDGWVVIAVASNKLFRRLTEAIGRAELGTDDRYRGVGGRIARREEVNGFIAAWVAERTVAEVVAALGPTGANVPCSPVHTVDQLLTHPQLLARDMIRRLADPELGEVVVHGVVPKLSATPTEVRTAGPTLGQHNAEVYGELLGLGADELAALASRKVI
jgi:crotonobetainyl-CoA:carnitine CoA-transferase CaiB-like acyl-CoA transferase